MTQDIGKPERRRLTGDAIKRYGFNKRIPLVDRRKQFVRSPYLRGKRNSPCWVCLEPAEARHHIIELQHGGTNAKRNVIPICRGCHAEVHPWMKKSEQPHPTTAFGNPVGGLEINGHGQSRDKMMELTAPSAAIKMAFSSSEFPGQRAGSRSRITTYVPVHNGTTEQKRQSRFSGRAHISDMLQAQC